MEAVKTPELQRQLPEWITLSCVRIEPVGSRVVCNPPPMDTDQDWLCLTNPNMNFSEFIDELCADEWYSEGSAIVWGASVRKGVDNLILVAEEKYFNNFMTVTEEAKTLNILDKKKRVAFYNKRLKELGTSKVKFKKYAELGATIQWPAAATLAFQLDIPPAPLPGVISPEEANF